MSSQELTFIDKYLIEPLYQDTFNPINTLVYAGLFLLLFIILLRIFKRYGISLDFRFYSYFLGFIFLGALLGALKDVLYQGSPWMSTPGIYFGLSVLFIGSLVTGRILEVRTGIPYSVLPQLVVYIPFIYLFIIYFPVKGVMTSALHILILSLALSLAVYLVLKKAGSNLLENRVNFGVFLAHMLDASSTYLGVTRFGFGEKFFVMGYLIEKVAPEAVFVAKALLVLLVLYFVERDTDLKKMSKDAIKAALILLGMAPALRNTFLSVLL